MYNPTVLDHFQNPRNAGELPSPAITVENTNPVCGDILRLSLRAEAGSIAAVAFKAKGCVAAIAAASILTELVQGNSVAEVSRLTADDIATALGGLPAESGHAAELAFETLRAGLRKAAVLAR
jgi:nitrogen fixation NifU-like protein